MRKWYGLYLGDIRLGRSSMYMSRSRKSKRNAALARVGVSLIRWKEEEGGKLVQEGGKHS